MQSGVVLIACMASYIITAGKEYIQPVYDYFHRELLKRRFLMMDETPVQILEEGRQGYNKVKDTKRYCCFAHVRRYFLEAVPKGHEKDYTDLSLQRVLYCDILFAYECSYKEKGLSHKQIRDRRLRDQKPVLEGFLTWTDQVSPGNNARLKKALLCQEPQGLCNDLFGRRTMQPPMPFT